MFSEPMYECTSKADTNFFFESSQKHFCKGCIKKYCENYVNYISFKNLKNYYLQFFLVFSLEKKSVKNSKCVVAFRMLPVIVWK